MQSPMLGKGLGRERCELRRLDSQKRLRSEMSTTTTTTTTSRGLVHRAAKPPRKAHTGLLLNSWDCFILGYLSRGSGAGTVCNSLQPRNSCTNCCVHYCKDRRTPHDDRSNSARNSWCNSFAVAHYRNLCRGPTCPGPTSPAEILARCKNLLAIIPSF